MNTTRYTEKTYRLTIVTVVDRPELRSHSYAPVAPGAKFTNTEWFADQGSAVRVFNEILRGSWDFASEYVYAVELCQMRHNRSPRTVRCRVERPRHETESILQWRQRSLQVSAVRRAVARGADTSWLFPLVWRLPPIQPDPAWDDEVTRPG